MKMSEKSQANPMTFLRKNGKLSYKDTNLFGKSMVIFQYTEV